MQLNYRGVSYQNSNSSLEATTEEIGGVYRGVFWRNQPLNKQIVPSGIAQLKYRGADYSHVVYDELVKDESQVFSLESHD